MTLWDEYAKTKSRDIRNEIVEQYHRLVSYIVSRMINSIPHGVTRDDLIQFGLEGLMEAVDRYDRHQGAKFETFATKRIHGKIRDELRKYSASNGGPTRTTITKMKRVEEAIHTVENRLQRNATMEEIADELGITLKEYQKLLVDIGAYVPMSLDKMISADGTLSVVDVLPNEASPQPEKEFLKKETLNQLIQEIDNLPPKEHRIIVSYYYEELTLREIGYQLGLTEGSISQLHTNILLRLRSRLKGRP